MKAKLSTANPHDWFVYWQDETGRQFRKRAGINRIKSIPERRLFGKQLLERVNQMISGGVVADPPMIEQLRKICDSKKGTLRHRSWQSYHYAVNMLEKWIPNKDMRIGEFTKSHAKQFMDHLYRSGFGGYTINGVRSFLSTLFASYAEREEQFVNPFYGHKKAIQQVGRNLAFNDKEKELIWRSLDEPLRLFTRFIYFTYLRPLELLRLRVRDIQTEHGVIVIQGHQSKNKRQQSVVIPDVFALEIAGMGLSELPGDWYVFGRGLLPGPVSYGRNQVSKRHRTVLDSMGFTRDYTLYSWKHTGVVNAYRNKVPIYEIMRQLRHHSLDMTQIYLKSLGLERNTEFARLMG